MIQAAERLLDDYAEGRISRREAARRVMAVAVAALGAGAVTRDSRAEEPTFRATGLNHLGLRVTDVARSVDFYRRHLGLEVIRDSSPANCFLRAGDHYLGLFRAGEAAMDHFCLTVEGYGAGEAMARLTAAGFRPRRSEDRVYFDDPDGLEVQLDSRFGSWPGPAPG